MNVSAVIVTRGNVDLRPVLDSLPREWEQVVWNNSGYDSGASVSVRRSPAKHERTPGNLSVHEVGPDMSVYGRYAAIEFATWDVIYVQDDDCIVSDPQQVVDMWEEMSCLDLIEAGDGNIVVCNQPEPWRSNPFYADHALVGFGAAFHRDAPERAWRRWMDWRGYIAEWPPPDCAWLEPWFLRTCDIVFTALTPRVLVDIPHTSFDYASDPDRMWRQLSHQSERQRMLDLVLQVR